MKIKLLELRNLIRTIIKENNDAPTISSQLDPKEKELNKNFPKWGNKQGEGLKQQTPAAVKAKQVTAILQQKGLTSDANNKKKVTQMLLPFLEKMDPTDMFTMTTEDIANQFIEQVINKN